MKRTIVAGFCAGLMAISVPQNALAHDVHELNDKITISKCLSASASCVSLMSVAWLISQLAKVALTIEISASRNKG